MAGVARCRCSVTGCIDDPLEYGLRERADAGREAHPVGIRCLPAAHSSEPGAHAHETVHSLHEAEATKPIHCILDRSHAHACLARDGLQLGVDPAETDGIAEKDIKNRPVVARGRRRLPDDSPAVL
jgi:hypothetical protein